jgi:hypothetical protein
VRPEDREELASSAAVEAGRLAGAIAALQSALAQAEAERGLVADWPPERLEALRAGLRHPRFGDVEGYGAELARAQAELGAIDDLRRTLADG